MNMILNVIKLKTSVLVLLMLSLFISCDKGVEEELLGETSSISFSVVGIVEPLELGASVGPINQSVKEDNSQLIKIGDIGYTTSFGSTVRSTRSHRLNKLVSTSSTIADPGITYRFILFKKNGSRYDFVDYKDANSASGVETLSFEVSAGSAYKWVAYSYNNNNAITDVINSSSLSIETAIDKDLLYDCGELTIGESEINNIANIRFEHRLARIAITLDATDYPAIFIKEKCSIKLSNDNLGYFKKGVLDLLNNSIENIEGQEYSAYLPFQQTLNSSEDRSTITAYMYTSEIGGYLKDLKLDIIDLTVVEFYNVIEAQNGNDTRVEEVDLFVNPKISNKLGISIKANTSITIKAGHSYSATMKFEYPYDGVLKEGGVVEVDGDDVNVNDIVWARANLTYNPADGKIAINKNIHNNLYVSAKNDYWMFNSVTPWDPFVKNTVDVDGEVIYDRASGITKDSGQQLTNQWDNMNDPCKKVGDKGEWRLPSFAEALHLGGDKVPVASRKQSVNWNDSKKNISYNLITGTVTIPFGAYTFFEGYNGSWVPFYKSGTINTTSDYRVSTNEWNVKIPDSFVMPVSDAYDSFNDQYNILQIDGEKAYFNDNGTSTHIHKAEKSPIRCVKDCDAACKAQFLKVSTSN